MANKHAQIELHSGGVGGKISGSVNIAQAIIITILVVYFIWTQHEFASLHTEIGTLEAALRNCTDLITKYFEANVTI